MPDALNDLPPTPADDSSASDAASLPVRFVQGGAKAVVYWMPVWVPLGFLAQIGLLGLKPALQEEQRLAEAEQRLDSRLEGLTEERGDLERDLIAFEDPIFIERLRRLRDRR